ncbi:MAG: TPM domain-containing protein [Lewinellaceae bacterium]|nr:TPM domain-containing protein [Lewinellaceae bacterium]MCB9290635.1 TPM domain-containing protein [Lewinellaceae bacterium]
MYRFLLFLVILLSGSRALAQTVYTVETIPDPKQNGNGYVSNPDNILSGEEVQQLNTLITELERNSTAQVAIVIVNSIGEDNPKEFATRLFQYWGIGQSDKDNGLLIFTVMDQRRTEFETGYGLEGVLPDVICYRIGMQELVPYFREGKYGQGLYAATAKIKETLESPEALEEIRSEMKGKEPFRPVPGLPAVLGWYFVVVLIFHFFLLIWLLYTRFSKQELYDRYMAVRPLKSIVFFILFPIPFAAVYYYLGRLLKNLRNHPRYSKVNGKLMHKLDEQADDAFLEQGQVTEEEIGSVDYDVWVTDDHDDVLILRYAKRWTKYEKCPKCSYVTYHKQHSRVLRPATYNHSGKREITFACKNCNYTDTRIEIIPQKVRSSGGGGGGGFSGGGGSSWGGGSSGGGGAGVSW